MSQPFRLTSGGRIDRNIALGFEVDGRAYRGHPGDTLASAMLANGVHLAGRSFKYHRPRGIVSAGPEEPNALFGIDRGGGRFDVNTRATQVAICDGLRAISQNRWPSLAFDTGALAGAFGRLMPAGFYYKTFMWPRWAWEKVYEPAIRAVSGLGRAPRAPDPDHYIGRYAHCDVLVVGGGPAGLAAALAAAEGGARVILCDEQEELGGSLLARPQQRIDGQPAWEWLAAAVAQLQALGVRLLPRTTAFAYQAQNFVVMAERVADHVRRPAEGLARQRLWQVRAKQVALATGAIERTLVFGNNDRPGILLAGAAQAYVNRYAVLPGQRAVLVATHDSGYGAALDFAAAGGTIVAVVDPRGAANPQGIAELSATGAEILLRHTVTDTKGRLRVNGVRVAPLDERGAATSRERWIDCDLVMMAGGWTPSIHLFAQSRGTSRWDGSIHAFIPAAAAQAQRSVGACAGTFPLSAALAEGYAAGAQISIDAGARRRAMNGAPRAKPGPEEKGMPPGALPSGDRRGYSSAFVDFQNDVTVLDIKLALAEGFHSIEHVKRYTTTGMATDQGKTSNLNALGIVAETLHKTIPGVGTTTFRAPYTPVAFGTLAGANRGLLFEPVRLTPMHGWAAANGAIFEDVGQWKRARYYPRVTEDMHAAVRRECRQTRAAVGMLDASTLGKIEAVGPDAAEFLDRMYVSPVKHLPLARCRYSIMLGEDGFIFDDGIIARLAADRFHVTTTTGGAVRVLHMMEDYLQTEFRDLDVWLTSITEQWAVIAVSGPKARELLVPLVGGIDLANDAFPHMAVRAGTVCGVAARLFRVSFTGELGYEINVPADYGRFVWERIHEAGAPYGIVAYGTETMHVLRAEKGYIIVGQETDGTVMPGDVGLDGVIGKTKADFVGKRSLSRPDALAQDRKQLVGLRSRDRRTMLDEGVALVEREHGPASRRLLEHVRQKREPFLRKRTWANKGLEQDDDAKQSHPALGHVTSSYWSESIGEPIALALLRNGRARIGETLMAQMPDRRIEVEVVQPVFHDPHGERLNA